MKTTIDLNCDLGEGMPTDVDLFPYISSANIACGFHAGDAETIAKSIRHCIAYNVNVGAHPGYADKTNFGRTEQFLSPQQLKDLVTKQLEILLAACDKQITKLHHVKLHGALYNQAAETESIAIPVLEAIKAMTPNVIIYGLSESKFNDIAGEMGFAVKHEVFADRKYTKQKTLVPRSLNGAVIKDNAEVTKQVKAFISETPIETIDGNLISLKADTICLHGDSQNAITFVQLIIRILQQLSISTKNNNG
jgi:5-oxoprolinase (ATP-hydrolysing) subunit A